MRMTSRLTLVAWTLALAACTDATGPSAPPAEAVPLDHPPIAYLKGDCELFTHNTGGCGALLAQAVASAGAALAACTTQGLGSPACWMAQANAARAADAWSRAQDASGIASSCQEPGVDCTRPYQPHYTNPFTDPDFNPDAPRSATQADPWHGYPWIRGAP